MALYRKKPTVIEAVRVTYEFRSGPMNQEVRNLLDRGICNYTPKEYGSVAIHTLEGTMLAEPGDWVIKEVEGETYPCKDSVFQATYEKVED